MSRTDNTYYRSHSALFLDRHPEVPLVEPFLGVANFDRMSVKRKSEFLGQDLKSERLSGLLNGD